MKRFTKLIIVATLLAAGMSGAAQNNDAAQNVTVTCNMISNSETTLPYSVELIPRSTNLLSAQLYYGANPDLTFHSVEPGYYDIVGDFSIPIGAIVLKENIHVQQDTTIEINASEANAFDIKAYKPDGVKFELNEYEYIDGERVLVKEGNIDSCFACGGLLRKTDMNLIKPINGEYRGGITYINDFGEDYIFVYALVYCDKTNGEFYITKFYKDGNGSTCLENDINDYVCSENEFEPSCIGSDSSDMGNGISVYLIYNGKYINNNDCMTTQNDKIKIWSCVPFASDAQAGGFDVLFKPGLVDYRDPITTGLYSIWGPSTAIMDGERYFICNNDRALDFLADANDSYLKSIYPGSPTFSYAEDEMGGVFGNNVPVNMFIERSIYDFMGGIIPQFACYYMGRFGEWREVDLTQLEVTLKVNGETIDHCTTYSSLNNNYFAPWNFFREKGITEFTFDNKNVEVDGMQGHNFTRVIFDETKEDHCAPTLTMLQMRDANGTVTDRFETASDGKVTFSCGDFNTSPEIITVNFAGMSRLYLKDSYECERPEVELNVSPYGLDQWQVLDFSEDVDAFMPIGFGHVFNADITDLTNEGWYDLKFKLTDAVGNMQEQVISPAFRIGSGNPTSIEAIESDAATEVARYTIDGRAISAPQTGVNIIKMSDGTVKKVLIK